MMSEDGEHIKQLSHLGKLPRTPTSHYEANQLIHAQSLSLIQLFATSWTIGCQAPLSIGFSRQVNWSGLPCPSPGDLPHPGIKPWSPALQADSLPFQPPSLGVCIPNPKLLCRFLPSFAIYVLCSNKRYPVSPRADELTF